MYVYVYVYVGVRLSSPPQNRLPPGSERGIFLGAEADLGWPGKGRIYLFIYLFIYPLCPGIWLSEQLFFFLFLPSESGLSRAESDNNNLHFFLPCGGPVVHNLYSNLLLLLGTAG